MLGGEAENDKPGVEGIPDAVFVIENPVAGSSVARLEHNTRTGLVTFIDRAGKIVGEKLLTAAERAWLTQNPKAEKYYPFSTYAYCINNPVKFIDPNGEEIYLYEVASYLNRTSYLSGGMINNDMMRMVGGFEVSPYLNKNGNIIGWSAYRDGRIQYVMDDPGDIDVFVKNSSTFGVAADFFYMNDTPSKGQMAMVAGDAGSGLLQQWGAALRDPGYYMYATNAFGAAVMMMPQKGANSYTHGYSYADRVAARAVDASHRFPYSFDDAILSNKPIARPNQYNIYQMNGSMNGRTGVYEIGVNKSGIIDHRFFRPNK